jgi:hypothetical protein
LSLPSTIPEDSASFPAEVVLCMQLTLPLEFLDLPNHSPRTTFLGMLLMPWLESPPLHNLPTTCRNNVADALAGVPTSPQLANHLPEEMSLPPTESPGCLHGHSVLGWAHTAALAVLYTCRSLFWLSPFTPFTICVAATRCLYPLLT